ncbi:MAG TPA: DUF72 domain-containing protein [Anaerolineales bacterium]|nr:DUF72 domain-containing protein [Anaerolineales bacterium]
MNLWVGTSGYSYKEWKGGFYPAKLPDSEMLHSYAERLPAVEINNTFYRLPKADVLEGWAGQVTSDFRFVLKASRRITHIKRLREAGEETNYLYQAALSLGPHMGVVLFQLPPNFQKDVPRLQSFLELLPAGRGAAFEFRHESWFEEDAFSALRAAGCALVLSDTDDAPLDKLVSTAPWGYLRLRKEKYTKKAIEKIAEGVRTQPWREAYVFFKDEGEGAGPKYALQFLGRTGS